MITFRGNLASLSSPNENFSCGMTKAEIEEYALFGQKPVGKAGTAGRA